jgi:guanylate kinase/ubiquinone/menaquinone biosynthesis C-methylase UbiE
MSPRQPKPAPILFSGPSGIGKTTLIHRLINAHPELYARPVSLTTRQRREGEGDAEYRFVTVEEFERFIAEGKLANSDTVYGNLYGITTESLQNLCEQSLCPVKEVRPENHHKIRAEFPRTLSVLLTSLRPPSFDGDRAREERMLSDRDYFSTLDHDQFDLIFPVPDLPLLAAGAEHLHTSLACLLTIGGDYPPASQIDRTNRTNYALVMPEFHDATRPTTANFHDLTRKFWGRIAESVTPGAAILELGVGNGWLMGAARWPEMSYRGVDIISSANPQISVASCRELPFESESFDYIVASLADPFLFPAALREIHRIMKPGAIFAFTSPAREWSELLRKGEARNQTTFRLKSGEEAQVYSFCIDNTWFDTVLPLCGFRRIDGQASALRDLPASCVVSAAISSAAETNPDLPIVYSATVKKL